MRTQELLTHPAMQCDSDSAIHEYSLKEVVMSLTALVNEADGDDDRKLDSFQYDLTSMLADVAGAMASKKEIPEDGDLLCHFLDEVQRMAHRLERSNTLQATLEAIVKHVDTEYWPLGSEEANKTLYEIYRLVSEVAFTNGRENELLFATKFFFAFVR